MWRKGEKASLGKVVGGCVVAGKDRGKEEKEGGREGPKNIKENLRD